MSGSDKELSCEALALEQFPDFLEFKPPMHLVTGVVFVVLSLYVLVPYTYAIWHRDLYPLNMRSPMLLTFQTIGLMIHLIHTYLKHAVGPSNFPCILDLVVISFWVPMCIGPQTVGLAQMHNRVLLTNAMMNFRVTEKNADLDSLLRKVHKTGKMNEFKLILVANFMPFVVFVYAAATIPIMVSMCTRCDTPKVSRYSMFVFACSTTIPSLILLKRLKPYEDPSGLRAICAATNKVYITAALTWLAMGTLKVGNLEETGYFSAAWILTLALIITHRWICISPVLAVIRNPEQARRFRTRKQQPKSKYKAQDTRVTPSEGTTMSSLSAGWTLANVLEDSKALEYFEKHLAAEFNIESILFYKSAMQWKNNYNTFPSNLSRNAVAHNIYETFIPESARLQINIDATMRGKLADEISAIANSSDGGETVELDRWIFDCAIEEIFNLLKRDSFERFRKTQAYNKICETLTLKKDTSTKSIFGQSQWTTKHEDKAPPA